MNPPQIELLRSVCFGQRISGNNNNKKRALLSEAKGREERGQFCGPINLSLEVRIHVANSDSQSLIFKVMVAEDSQVPEVHFWCHDPSSCWVSCAEFMNYNFSLWLLAVRQQQQHQNAIYGAWHYRNMQIGDFFVSQTSWPTSWAARLICLAWRLFSCIKTTLAQRHFLEKGYTRKINWTAFFLFACGLTTLFQLYISTVSYHTTHISYEMRKDENQTELERCRTPSGVSKELN